MIHPVFVKIQIGDSSGESYQLISAMCIGGATVIITKTKM